jgi:cell fate regulator YaaT (PSP1 superfamily)
MNPKMDFASATCQYGIIEPMSPFIVGVRFAQIGKSYHFDASTTPQVKVGDHVIVETSRGKQLGEVTQIVKDPVATPEGWKPVERIATPRDLVCAVCGRKKNSKPRSPAASAPPS